MEQSFSERTMLDSLRDIRLPTDAPGGALADLLTCVGLAGLAAWICVLALRLCFRPRDTTPVKSLSQQVKDISALPEPERRVALLHLLRQHAPARYEALSDALYRPGQLDLARLEAEVAALV